MGNGDRALGLAQDAPPRVALRQGGGVGQGTAQQAPCAVCIAPIPRRSQGLYPLAIGFDQGDVDPVERGAAHQTDCRHHHRHGAFLGLGGPPLMRLCQTSTSYNATVRRAAAAYSATGSATPYNYREIRMISVAHKCMHLN